MQQCALVLVEPRNGRPLPVVEDAAGVDEDVAVIADDSTGGQVLNLDVVTSALVVPVGADNLVAGLDVLLQAVLVGEAIKVVEDLLGRGVDSGPVELGLEAPGVVVRGDVAGAAVLLSRLSVMIVRAALGGGLQLTPGTCSRTRCRQPLGSFRRLGG